MLPSRSAKPPSRFADGSTTDTIAAGPTETNQRTSSDCHRPAELSASDLMLRRTDRNGPLDSAPATTADMNTECVAHQPAEHREARQRDLDRQAERHDDRCDPAPPRCRWSRRGSTTSDPCNRCRATAIPSAARATACAATTAHDHVGPRRQGARRSAPLLARRAPPPTVTNRTRSISQIGTNSTAESQEPSEVESSSSNPPSSTAPGPTGRSLLRGVGPSPVLSPWALSGEQRSPRASTATPDSRTDTVHRVHGGAHPR